MGNGSKIEINAIVTFLMKIEDNKVLWIRGDNGVYIVCTGVSKGHLDGGGREYTIKIVPDGVLIKSITHWVS